MITEDVAEAMGVEIGRFVREELSKLEATLRAEMEVRLAERTADALKKLSPTWRGAWRPNISYPESSLVVCGNALWLCEHASAERPGTPDSGWRLVIKSPR